MAIFISTHLVWWKSKIWFCLTLNIGKTLTIDNKNSEMCLFSTRYITS